MIFKPASKIGPLDLGELGVSLGYEVGPHYDQAMAELGEFQPKDWAEAYAFPEKGPTAPEDYKSLMDKVEKMHLPPTMYHALVGSVKSLFS